MKYQVGDKVLLLHSLEEGIILELLDDQMARVMVDGVDFPVYLDQLDFPYYYTFSKKNQPAPRVTEKVTSSTLEIPKEKSFGKKKLVDRGGELVFLPVLAQNEAEFLVERFKVYLSNRTPYSFWFSYAHKKRGQVHWSIEGTSQSDTDFYLHDILFEDFSDNPSFDFSIKPLGAPQHFTDKFTVALRIKPRQLFEQLEKIRLEKLASFSWPIFESFPEKKLVTELTSVEMKSTTSQADVISKSRQDFEDSFSLIVDLHIENLLSDWKGLSNFEILQTQLSYLEKMIERAIRNQQPSLIVIHGIGEGKLKSEIHQYLRQIKEVHSFDNRYDPRFGQGATTIQFQY